jgi:hypothetical protein
VHGVGEPLLLTSRGAWCHNARVPTEPLDRLTERLERAAAELRSGSLSPDQAAALVDDCARLAGEASVELERQVRAGDADAGGNGQLALES